MDDDAIRGAFREHHTHARANGEEVFSRRRVIAMADMFGMKPMAMVWKLEKMRLLGRGAYAWFGKYALCIDDDSCHVAGDRPDARAPSHHCEVRHG